MLGQLAAGMAHQLRNALTGARLSLQLHLKRCEGARADSSMTVALRQLALIEEQVRGLLDARAEEELRPSPATWSGCFTTSPRSCSRVRAWRGRAGSRAMWSRGRSRGGRAQSSRRGTNLTLNAIEAAGPGGSVRLELDEAGRAERSR